MAKIGLKYPVYATATDNGTSITYSNGKVFAKAVEANVSIELNDVKLPADDAIAESDKSFSSGSVSMGVDDFSSTAKVDLLGYTEGAEVDATTGEKELSTAGAEAPYVGFGFYGKGVKAGVPYWRAIWLVKVKFGEPTEDFKTKGETVEFQTPTVEGTVVAASYDATYWKDEARFSTESGAIAWLNGKAGISSAASNNITALTASNGTFTPAFAEGTYNYSLAVTNNTVINATFAAGIAKLYVDGAFVQNLLTTVNAAAITMAAGNNKIIQIVVNESGKSAITYTIMAQRAAG